MENELKSPMDQQVIESEFQEFFFLDNVEFNPKQSANAIVDVWLLAEGLDNTKLDTLRNISTSKTPVCCFEFVEGAPYHVKQLLRGFARVIVHKKYNGIMNLMEGRFKDGVQYDFGRFLNMWPYSRFYDYEQSYTGWFPDAVNVGQGIATVDSKYVF